MSDFARLSKINLLAAIRDYPRDPEALGEACEAFGLDSEAADLMIVDRGKQYDARLLWMAAYRKATGDILSESDLPTDLARLLTRLELSVLSRREAIAAETLKAARHRVPGSSRPSGVGGSVRASAAAAPAEPAPPVCPSCFMQLPAGSKECNYCY